MDLGEIITDITDKTIWVVMLILGIVMFFGGILGILGSIMLIASGENMSEALTLGCLSAAFMIWGWLLLKTSK